MELVDVDVVRPQIAQALGHILCHVLFCKASALCGNDKLVPDAREPVAQVFFGNGVTSGGVNVVDAFFQKTVHQHFRAISVNTLNGNAAAAHAGYLQSGFSKGSVFHVFAPFLVFYIIQRVPAEIKKKIRREKRRKGDYS